MILGVDISHWQKTVDWDALKNGGVEFVIVKATQGTYQVDPMLADHISGATKVGIDIGAYHWVDPLVNAEAQAAYFLSNIKDLPIRFIVADVEQYWSDWNEWMNQTVQKVISPDKISDTAKTIMTYWGQHSSLPEVIYTRATFVQGWAQPMQKWINKYDLWLAHYPYNNTRVKTTWEDFKLKYKPAINGPQLPTNCTQWKFWQFTGGKFILPGTDSTMDVDYFNGTSDDFHKFIKLTPTTPVKVSLPEWARQLDQWARGIGFNGPQIQA
jgi:GH25 family lysozyme M1 (1,4-beta-N-acetylmuramidase)